MIEIIVCLKQVIDPEAPVSTFRIDPEAKRAIPPPGTPPVLNPHDENALEAALRIKDGNGARITVINMGRNISRPVLKKALAVGADVLIILEDNSFTDLDSYITSHILAGAIRKIGRYDLIVCGRQASDTDAGQVGSGIAEILGIPSITVARKVEVGSGKARVERIVPDGYEVIEAPMPALVTASNEVGELRSATLKAMMAANQKTVTVWNAADIGFDPGMAKRTRLLKLYTPVHEARCQFVEGTAPEEAAVNLAMKLREAGII